MFEHPIGEADASLLGLNLSYNDLRSLLTAAIKDAEPTDPDNDGDNDTYIWICDLYGTHVIYSTDYDESPLKMRSYSVDAVTRAVTLGDAVAVARKTMYVPLPAEGTQESAQPARVYLAEAGKRHSKHDVARLKSMHDSARAIIVHAGALDPGEPAAKEADAGDDTKARLRSIHDSAHSIAAHAVTMLGPSSGAEGGSGTSLLPLLQSAREGDEPLQESGAAVAIFEVGEAHISESKSAPDKGVFEMTIIRPGFNSSGSRYYKKEAIADAASNKLFDGKKMYIDHPTVAEEKALPERSVSKIGAVIQETYLGAEGELRGKAAIVNPQLKDMLSLMKEQGLLHHIGVSINATGTVTSGAVDGRRTHIVEGFTSGKSVDFVTEPGAGGRIALYESSRGQAPVVIEHKESSVNEEQINKILAELAALRESNTKLENQLTESDQRAEQAEARAKVQGQVATKLAAIAESELPQIAKARVTRMFEDATNCDRLDEVIESEKGYVKEIAEKLAPKAAKGGVTGLGSRVTEGAQDVIAPVRPSENEGLVEAISGMHGSSKDEARDFIRRMTG